MKPVMYIFINRGLGMSPGKMAAQASHAAVEAFRLSREDLIDAWYVGGHYTKLVMEARDSSHLASIATYLDTRGFHGLAAIIDEGRTEIAPHSFTALGVEIVDKDDEHTAATFANFKTFRGCPSCPPRREGIRKFPLRDRVRVLFGREVSVPITL